LFKCIYNNWGWIHRFITKVDLFNLFPKHISKGSYNILGYIKKTFCGVYISNFIINDSLSFQSFLDLKLFWISDTLRLVIPPKILKFRARRVWKVWGFIWVAEAWQRFITCGACNWTEVTCSTTHLCVGGDSGFQVSRWEIAFAKPT